MAVFNTTGSRRLSVTTVLKQNGFAQLAKDIQSVKNNPTVMTQLNQALADRCEKYVPVGETGELATPKVRANGVTYDEEYAHYQYKGEVYGRNIPVIIDGNIAWRSKKPKYPTGRKLGEPGVLKDRYGNILWVFGYTNNPNATPEWDKTMLREEGDEFAEDCSDIIGKYLRRKARIEAARASIW